MKKLITYALIISTLLLCSCGDDNSSSSKADTTSKESTSSSQAADSSSAADSKQEDSSQQEGGYAYTDTKVDPFELDKQGGGDDYDNFAHTEDIARSVWGAFYEEKYGADKTHLTPQLPEGYTDLGGAANIQGFSFGVAGEGEKTFSVKVDVMQKYDDIVALYHEISAKVGEDGRDIVKMEEGVVTEHFAESIYFEYTVNAVNSQGLRIEVSSINKDVTLDELIKLAKGIHFFQTEV